MTTDRDPIRALAAFLAAQPDVTGKLLALHVPDPDGRCRACTINGGGRHWVWPCRISLAAGAARRLGSGEVPGP